MDHFKLHSEYQPTGDQPQAIEKLVKGLVLLIVVGISMVTFGSIVCNKVQPARDFAGVVTRIVRK